MPKRTFLFKIYTQFGFAGVVEAPHHDAATSQVRTDWLLLPEEPIRIVRFKTVEHQEDRFKE